MENKEPAPGGLSPRALRHAVREYLANDLGVDKAYVDRVIAGVVSARYSLTASSRQNSRNIFIKARTASRPAKSSANESPRPSTARSTP